MKNIPPELKFTVEYAKKIQEELGFISVLVLARKLKITFEKAEELIKFIE